MLGTGYWVLDIQYLISHDSFVIAPLCSLAPSGQQAVERKHVGFGAGYHDVVVGTATAEHPPLHAVLADRIVGLDADGHPTHGVNAFGHGLDGELDELVRLTDDAVDGPVDGVHWPAAVVGVAIDLTVWPADADGGGGDAVVAAGDLDVFQ